MRLFIEKTRQEIQRGYLNIDTNWPWQKIPKTMKRQINLQNPHHAHRRLETEQHIPHQIL